MPATCAALLACHPKPPEPLPAVEHKAAPANHDHVAVYTAVPRPQLRVEDDLPDLSEEMRWPLSITDHPNLEPHYPVARVLAEPGISWTELCARGAQNRHDPSHKDELAYLGAWCAVMKHDTSAAVTQLAPLLHSSIWELASAVPFDIAFILVANEDADHADQLLGAVNLKDPHLWDLIAASYYEISKNTDAIYATSAAQQVDSNAADAVTCHRLARQIMLGSSAYRDVWVNELKALAAHKVPAQGCLDLASSVPCTTTHDCGTYFAAQHKTPDQIAMFEAYEHWPLAGDRDTWINTAWRARKAWPADGAVDLVNAALEGAIISTRCGDPKLEDVDRAADAIAVGVSSLRPKADWVHTMLVDYTACEEFHERWQQAAGL